MPNPPITVVEQIDGMRRKDDQSSLTIHFHSGGKLQTICFPRAVLADLIAGLAGMQSPQSGQPIDIPAILAEEIKPFQQDNGTTGLAVFLSGGWVLPLAIPAHAIQSMRQTLADLELLATNPKGNA